MTRLTLRCHQYKQRQGFNSIGKKTEGHSLQATEKYFLEEIPDMAINRPSVVDKDMLKSVYKTCGPGSDDRIRLIKNAFKVIITNILPEDKKAYLSMSKTDRKATLSELNKFKDMSKARRLQVFKERNYGPIEEIQYYIGAKPEEEPMFAAYHHMGKDLVNKV